MNQFNQAILRTDVSGMPMEWINYRQAVKFYCLDVVLYECGRETFTIHGGVNAATSRRSKIVINSILAISGHGQLKSKLHKNYTPPLTNKALFKRDFNHCLYCGNQFADFDLSRDHVTPIVDGGSDQWSNCVTACKRCNQFKGGRTPQRAGMSLLAIPFTPNYAEFIFLSKRKILADQMAFLRAHFPKKSPLHRRIDNHLQVCR